MPRAHPRLLAALVALVAGCGPAPRAKDSASPRPRPGGFRQVAPLAFAAEAKAPDQALILGTDPRGGATVVPLAGGPSPVALDLLVVRTAPVAVGATSPIALSTTPAAGGTVRVGIFEDTAGGLGPSWRTGVWMAAFVATSALGKDLTDFRFTAEATGHVDGASGSGLMAAGYLASMLGVAVDPTATMTGIINPDGTIGPVGGIPQKLDAAIAAGKRRVGYPIGLGQAQDLATGEPVDVEARAQAAGATAVEVADVYGALELLTGTRLPRPLPVDTDEMALEPAVSTALDERYAAWHLRLADEWTRVLELGAGRLPAPVTALVDAAVRRAAQADRLHRAGQAAAAHDQVVEAWIAAASATAIAGVLDLARAGDAAGARARLDELAAGAATVDERLRAIGGEVPTTMGAHLQMMSAFQHALGGWGFRAFTEDQLVAARAALADVPAASRALPATTEALAAAVTPAVVGVARAVAGATTADEAATIEQVTTLDYTCSLPNVRRLAASFRAAAGANLAYFESLFVAELASQLGMPLEVAKVRVATILPDYLVALMAGGVDELPGLPAELKRAWGDDSIAWGLFQLAAGEASFFRTSLLVSRFYSLGVDFDPATGRTRAVAQVKAFANMLTWAERRAREHARAAQVATGSIPVQARLHYQIAAGLVDGELDDRLAALEHYWAASLFAQTATMLARNGP